MRHGAEYAHGPLPLLLNDHSSVEAWKEDAHYGAFSRRVSDVLQVTIIADTDSDAEWRDDSILYIIQ